MEKQEPQEGEEGHFVSGALGSQGLGRRGGGQGAQANGADRS